MQIMIGDWFANDAQVEKIVYINTHFKEKPSLHQIAAAWNISPFRFQQIFTEWAGVSPKKFIQYINFDFDFAKGLEKTA
jgi:AraC family transcriptional regulator of adaptative response/methylated-DNA-[protein]-cysteine methyltransferase